MADLLTGSGVEIRVLPSVERVAEYTAGVMTRVLSRCVAEAGRAVVSLAGGTTPRAAYDRLCRFPGIDGVFWVIGDERFVPVDSEQSNQRMLRERLFEPLAIEESNILTPNLHLEGAAAVEAYGEQLRERLGAEWTLDLSLLGIGADGHTASLFPGDYDPYATDAAVLARAPQAPFRRISLSLSTLNRARMTIVLAVGKQKAEAVRRAIAEPPNREIPASQLKPDAGRLLWVVDRAAASDFCHSGSESRCQNG